MGDKIAKIYANTDQVSKHGDGYDFLCFKFNLMNQSFTAIHFTFYSSPVRKELHGDNDLPEIYPNGASLKPFPENKNNSWM